MSICIYIYQYASCIIIYNMPVCLYVTSMGKRSHIYYYCTPRQGPNKLRPGKHSIHVRTWKKTLKAPRTTKKLPPGVCGWNAFEPSKVNLGDISNDIRKLKFDQPPRGKRKAISPEATPLWELWAQLLPKQCTISEHLALGRRPNLCQFLQIFGSPRLRHTTRSPQGSSCYWGPTSICTIFWKDEPRWIPASFASFLAGKDRFKFHGWPCPFSDPAGRNGSSTPAVDVRENGPCSHGAFRPSFSCKLLRWRGCLGSDRRKTWKKKRWENPSMENFRPDIFLMVRNHI